MCMQLLCSYQLLISCSVIIVSSYACSPVHSVQDCLNTLCGYMATNVILSTVPVETIVKASFNKLYNIVWYLVYILSCQLYGDQQLLRMSIIQLASYCSHINGNIMMAYYVMMITCYIKFTSWSSLYNI